MKRTKSAHRLSSKEKTIIVKAILNGLSIKCACSKYRVSRNSLYRWLKLYSEKRLFKTYKKVIIYHKTRTNKSKNKIPCVISRKVTKLAISHPDYSIRKLSALSGVSVGSIWNILKKRDLSVKSNRKNYLETKGLRLYAFVNFSDKCLIINRISSGEAKALVGRDFLVSRTTIHKWHTEFINSNKDLNIFKVSDRPLGYNHWKKIPGIDNLLLDIVSEFPDYSLDRLHSLIVYNYGITISRSGLYFILRRLKLSTIRKREEYAAYKKSIGNQIIPVPDFKLPVLPRFSFNSFLSPPISAFVSSLTYFLLVSIFSFVVSLLLLYVLNSFIQYQTISSKIGFLFALVSFVFGIIFFMYSLKYYFTISFVLSYSRNKEDQLRDKFLNDRLGKASFVGRLLSRIFGIEVSVEDQYSSSGSLSLGVNSIEENSVTQLDKQSSIYSQRSGLQSDLSNVKLERNPFVSIHVSSYNEKRVIDRLLTACTSFDYPNYEVIVADDSSDETVDLINRWAHNPRVKISHREIRKGYKGAALAKALKMTDPRAEFILVFDADFIPYPDSIIQFLKYFKYTTGSLDFKPDSKDSNIAAVQGYQWHVLNKSENWITRGIRSEYSGSYVIERSGEEIYKGLKQISGSVYMIRKQVLEDVGWGTSITEDFELTLRLYEKGYKVVYTPYIQAPAEAVSTVKRLIRQRMRWAEGHSFNVKKMILPMLFGKRANGEAIFQNATDFKSVFKILRSPVNKDDFVPSPLTKAEKFEFVYLTPYYLQSAFFLVGTLSWFLAESVFQVALPFWTEIWGWSLVLTNIFALPLMNVIGMFMEESDEKDYLGIFSFIVLSYVIAPFQAYAAVKGFVEKEEGPWFRTPKTGRITDTFKSGRLSRFVQRILGRPVYNAVVSRGLNGGGINAESAGFLQKFFGGMSGRGSGLAFARLSANNQFNNFRIKRSKARWVGNMVLVVTITTSMLISSLAPLLPGSQTALAYEAALRTPGVNGDAGSDGVGGKSDLVGGETAEDIDVPRIVRRTTLNGEKVEFIFHKEPRVRIKLGDREIDVTSRRFGGVGVKPKKSVIKNDREVVYEDIVKGVDLKYTLTSDMIVEEFVVKDRAAFERMGNYQVEQNLSVVDVNVVTSDPGTFGFFDDNGKELFEFSSPFAKDAKNERNNDLSISLSKDVVGHRLIKSLGESAVSWMGREDRAYPVVIDPSVVVSGGIVDAETQYGGLQRKVVSYPASDAWCDTGTCDSNWTKRKSVTITNSGGSLTSYQVLLTVTYDADMNSDFSDLRFTNKTGTDLDYWLESKTDSTTADVWVEVDSLAAEGDTEIYMYYGYSSASSTSSGDNTFAFFDDFSSFDSGTWTATGSQTTSGGEMTVTTGAVYSQSAVASMPDSVVEARIKFNNLRNEYSGLDINNTNTGESDNANNDKLVYNSAYSNNRELHVNDGRSTCPSSRCYEIDDIVVDSPYSTGTYYVIGTAIDDTDVTISIDRASKRSYAYPWSGSFYMWFGYWAGAGSTTESISDMVVDWTLVRKYVDDEPTSDFGRELAQSDLRSDDYFYAFYGDGGVVYYKKSTDGGSSWGTAVDIDPGDTGSDADYNPSIAVYDDYIYAWWVDDEADRIEGRRIDAQDDTLGTMCSSAATSSGIDDSFTVSVAELTDTSVVVAYSDTTATASDVDIFKVTGLDGSCTATDIQPGNVTFGTQGSGITGSDRSVLFGIDSTHVGMIFQDGDLSYSYFDADKNEWRRNNQQIDNVTDDIYSVVSDGEDVWLLTKSGSTDTGYYKCCTVDTGAVLAATDSAAWDLSNSKSAYSFSTSSQDSVPHDLVFKPDGKRVFIAGYDTDYLYQYELTSPWEMSTATYEYARYSTGWGEADGYSMYIKPDDGTKMYIMRTSNSTIYQYTLDSPWSLASVTDDSKSYAVSEDSSIEDFYIRSDGVKMYVLGDTNDTVYQYTLGTAWDVSTATYDTGYSYTETQDTSPYAFDFKPGGSVMYILGDSNDSVYQYSLSTDWEVSASSVSYDSISYSLSSETTSPEGLVFNPEGTRMYSLNSSSGVILQYNMVPQIDIDVGGSAADAGRSYMDMDCSAGADDCKIVYVDDLDTSAPQLKFVDCDDASCNDKTVTVIDSDIGGSTIGGNPRIFCPSGDNCKIVYGDNLESAGPDAVFVDCNDATCSSPTSTVVDSDLGVSDSVFTGDVFCISDTDCKFIYFSSTDKNDGSVWFVDCANASCSSTDATTEVAPSANEDSSYAMTAMSIYCNSSTDCQVLYHDAENGDLTLIDCANSGCSSTDATTDIDTDVGVNSGGEQSISVPNKIDCSSAADDCKIVYADGSQNEFNFVDCSAAGCTSSSSTKIDDRAGGLMNQDVSLDCSNGGTDCKGTYVNNTGSSQDVYFFDCDSADCSSGSVVDLNDPPYISAVDCSNGSSDCKIVYYDRYVSASDIGVSFVDCTSEDCLPEWSTETSPWTSETNVSSVSISLDTSNNDIYASIIKDTSEQAYYKVTNKDTTSWGTEYSYAFTAGDLGNISSVEKAVGTSLLGVVVRQGSNFEFATLPEMTWVLWLLLPVLPRLMEEFRRRRRLAGVLLRC